MIRLVVKTLLVTLLASATASADYDPADLGNLPPGEQYRQLSLIVLMAAGNTPILDLGGNILDGEFLVTYPPSGDGVQGGDFIVQFSITTPITLGPTLTQIQAVIFGPTCATAGCHSGAVPDANLDLSDEATSRANLVGVSTTQLGGAGIRVISGDPDNSYLIQKLENAAGIEGQQMPLGGAPLPQADIDVIRQWITDGVP